MSKRVQIQFIEYLYDVAFGRYIPLTFIKYCIVGFLGVFVHMSAYYAVSRVIMQGGDLSVGGFSASVITATEIAVVFNYLLNNVWTFGNQKLKGTDAVIGFLKFNLACAFGALVNWGVSASLFKLGWQEFAAVFLGAVAGVVWNYTVNRMITWRE